MRRLSFTTYCGLLVLAPVICAGANDTEWTKRKFENRSLPESILNQEDHFAGRERRSELLMKEIKRLQESQATNTRTATLSKRVQKKTTAEPHHDPEVSGIDDIDKIRAEVRATPTDASNIMSRRTALYRWWRLLWHQGYDMNMSNYNAIWNRILINPGVNAAAQKAVDAAYAAMEDIAVNGTLIPEVPGKPDESGPTTETDWPVYHGTDGNQTGYSPDAGPSKGKIAWRVAKGNFWYATPVIENGKVYTAAPGADVMAYCLDEITGDVIWNGRQFGADIYQTPGSIFSPVVSSNKVLFTTGWWQADKHMVLNKKHRGHRVSACCRRHGRRRDLTIDGLQIQPVECDPR